MGFSRRSVISVDTAAASAAGFSSSGALRSARGEALRTAHCRGDVDARDRGSEQPARGEHRESPADVARKLDDRDPLALRELAECALPGRHDAAIAQILGVGDRGTEYLKPGRGLDGAAGFRDHVQQRLAATEQLEQPAERVGIDVVDEMDARPAAHSVRKLVPIGVAERPQQGLGT